MKTLLYFVGGVVILGGGVWYASQQGMGPFSENDVAIDGDDIGGVVMGSEGPEAGVWVIAETDDLPTKFVRSVITDDEGRYVIPDPCLLFNSPIMDQWAHLNRNLPF